MDVAALRERAEVGPFESPVADDPGWVGAGDDQDRWAADDPETGCRGVGTSRELALVNLRYAVAAYEDDVGEEVPYLSTGPDETYEMRWRRPTPSLGARLRRLLSPFR